MYAGNYNADIKDQLSPQKTFCKTRYCQDKYIEQNDYAYE